MATAIIGRVFTFQVLFVNQFNVAITPGNPTITIFSHSMTDGAKTTHVSAAALVAAVPAETGRYVYNFTLPASLEHGQTLYAEFKGTDPGAGNAIIIVEQQVECHTTSAATSLKVQFVKGG